MDGLKMNIIRIFMINVIIIFCGGPYQGYADIVNFPFSVSINIPTPSDPSGMLFYLSTDATALYTGRQHHVGQSPSDDSSGPRYQQVNSTNGSYGCGYIKIYSTSLSGTAQIAGHQPINIAPSGWYWMNSPSGTLIRTYIGTTAGGLQSINGNLALNYTMTALSRPCTNFKIYVRLQTGYNDVNIGTLVSTGGPIVPPEPENKCTLSTDNQVVDFGTMNTGEIKKIDDEKYRIRINCSEHVTGRVTLNRLSQSWTLSDQLLTDKFVISDSSTHKLTGQLKGTHYNTQIYDINMIEELSAKAPGRISVNEIITLTLE